MPTTWCFGNPVTCFISVTMASSGFETTITNAFGRVLLQRLGDGLDDLGVDADEIVAAHARLARHAGGDDADVGAREVGVVVAALDLDVEALDGPGGGEVERLALRQALDDVEQDDVAEPLQRAQVRERAADHAGADERDLLPCHGAVFLRVSPRDRVPRAGPSQTRKCPAVQAGAGDRFTERR